MVIRLVSLILCMVAFKMAWSQDYAQRGATSLRNNVGTSTRSPTRWDVGESKTNIKWVSKLGSENYGSPVVGDGRVFVCTNNGAGYIQRYPPNIDLGCLLCFHESDGNFLWQYSSEKLPTGRVHDWPNQGICSTPVLEGERIWFVDNRGQVVCADTLGFSDDEDDGLIMKESSLKQRDEADVVWIFDMMLELGVSQHNMSNCSPTIWGDLLFVCTSNGVDEGHVNLPAPDAPSFLALDKYTGAAVWTDNSPGRNILHGQWSSPAVGRLGGVPQVIFAGGDGWVYSFHAEEWENKKPKLLWKFDANPKTSLYSLGGKATRNSILAIPVIYDGLVYVNVGEDPEHGEGPGHLWCIDPTRRGDVSSELVVDESGVIQRHFRTCACSPSILLTTGASQETPWDNFLSIVPPQLAEFGFKLPKKFQIESEGTSTKFINAVIDGQPKRFRLRSNIFQVQGKDHYSLSILLETKWHVVHNPNSAVVWHYEGGDRNGDGEVGFEEQFHRGLSSVAIKDDLLFAPDFSGLVHCLDAKTGIPHWTYDMFAATWCSPLIIDEKVYVPDEDGDIAIFQLSADWRESAKSTDSNRTAGNESSPLTFDLRNEVAMLTAIYSTPAVANNVLYISTRNQLFAIEDPGHESLEIKK